ncbi:MAG: hypothetical protein NT169_17640 [Chloroflexi bacterium]|nr:hypothetical protein [Chloroflexota bacterium]
MAGLDERIRNELDRYAQFSPVLRFILNNEARRTFRAERWCYLGSIDDWIEIGMPGAAGPPGATDGAQVGQRGVFWQYRKTRFCHPFVALRACPERSERILRWRHAVTRVQGQTRSE